MSRLSLKRLIVIAAQVSDVPTEDSTRWFPPAADSQAETGDQVNSCVAVSWAITLACRLALSMQAGKEGRPRGVSFLAGRVSNPARPTAAGQTSTPKGTISTEPGSGRGRRLPRDA